MKLNDNQRTFLLSGLRRARISSRSVGGGRSASYLEAYDIRRTLIQVFGFGNFDIRTVKVECVVDRPVTWEGKRQGNTVTLEGFDVAYLATIELKIHGDDDRAWNETVYSASAVGSSTHQPDLTTAHDHALKSAESDALKRAAINLGTQFGLSLYENGNQSDIVKLTLDVDPMPDAGVDVGPVQPEDQTPAEPTEAEASQDSERPNVGTLTNEIPGQVFAQLTDLMQMDDRTMRLVEIGKLKSSVPDDVMRTEYEAGGQTKTIAAWIDDAAKRTQKPT